MKKLDENFIINLSKKKNEPAWMLDFRINSFRKFLELKNPDFGPEIDIDFDSILYYKSNTGKSEITKAMSSGGISFFKKSTTAVTISCTILYLFRSY